MIVHDVVNLDVKPDQLASESKAKPTHIIICVRMQLTPREFEPPSRDVCELPMVMPQQLT